MDICTRIFHFAKRTVEFRRYRTIRLGAPAKFIILHSKIGRRVDFSSYKNPSMQSGSTRTKFSKSNKVATSTYPLTAVLAAMEAYVY